MMFLILVFVCLCLFLNTENETLKVLNILPGNSGIPLLIRPFRKLVERDFATEQSSLSVVFKQFRKITLKAN